MNTTGVAGLSNQVPPVDASASYFVYFNRFDEQFESELQHRQVLLRSLTSAPADTPIDAHAYLHSFDLAYLFGSRRSGEIVGALLLGPSFPAARHAFLTLLSLDNRGQHRRLFEAVILAIGHLFESGKYQRLRWDIVGDNFTTIRSLSRRGTIEGVRRDWVYQEGAYRDAHLGSISWLEWQRNMEPMRQRIRQRCDVPIRSDRPQTR